MTEELQNLIDRIQKDGVEKAENESTRLLSEAKSKADEILKKASDQAAEIIDKARKDASAFEINGRKSLEQAARDVVISARTGIQKTIASVVTAEAGNHLDSAILTEMLRKVIDAYCSGASAAQIQVSPSEVEKFTKIILASLGEKARQGIQIAPDQSVSKGFKVILKDKNMELDLTDEAISDSLCRILRPHIAEILQKAVK